MSDIHSISLWYGLRENRMLRKNMVRLKCKCFLFCCTFPSWIPPVATLRLKSLSLLKSQIWK